MTFAGGSRHNSLQWVFALLLSLWAIPAMAQAPGAAPPGAVPFENVLLGPGDTVSLKVFGQPDMDGTATVTDEGTINLPLVGAVQVKGLTPDLVGRKLEKALKDGSFLVSPHVTVALVQSVTQMVAVLGEVRNPGRYQVAANTNVSQLLALAGGATATSADTIYLIRTDSAGNQSRSPIDLKGYTDAKSALPTQTFKGGDSIFVPRAEFFYIYGEVTQPNQYRLEPNMTVVQAIARAGGLTPRGSDRRVDVKRKGGDGKETTFRAKQSEAIEANDVIHVKESIF